jgi:signal transduction histidine kinase
MNMVINVEICRSILKLEQSTKYSRAASYTQLLIGITGFFPIVVNLNEHGYKVNFVYDVIFLYVMLYGVLFIFSILFLNALRDRKAAKIYLLGSLLKVAGTIYIIFIDLGLVKGIYNLEKVFVAFVIIELIVLTYVLARMYTYNKKRIRFQKNQRQAFYKQLLNTRLEIQEKTYKSISEELHDNIGQVLTLAKLHLNTIQSASAGEDHENILAARELISKCIQDIRNLSKTLDTQAIEALGFVKAIEMELRTLKKLREIEYIFELKGEPERLAPERELILFRIVQEAIQNIIKHANASQIRILVEYNEYALLLTIVDNGIGFNSEQLDGYGSGLSNMHSRAKVLHGELSVTSQNGLGTKVNISVPFKNRETYKQVYQE